jgi:hypothetical protein
MARMCARDGDEPNCPQMLIEFARHVKCAVESGTTPR